MIYVSWESDRHPWGQKLSTVSHVIINVVISQWKIAEWFYTYSLSEVLWPSSNQSPCLFLYLRQTNHSLYGKQMIFLIFSHLNLPGYRVKLFTTINNVRHCLFLVIALVSAQQPLLQQKRCMFNTQMSCVLPHPRAIAFTVSFARMLFSFPSLPG